MPSPRSESPAPGGPERPASGRGGRAAVFAGLSAAFVLALVPLCVFPVSDSDTWWHLATGRLILEQRAVPHADPFSYTVAGREWVTHEWLAQVVGHAVEAAGGLGALILLKTAVILAAFGILASLAVRRGAPPAPVLLLLLLAASLSADRYTERPQVATLLLFAGFLSVLLDHRDAGRDRLLALPPLTALWANLHSGFVFGLALVGVFLADAVLRRTGARRLGIVFGACIVAAMLNPNGVHSLLYPLEILTDSHYATVTAEYQPIRIADFAVHTHVAVFVAMLALGVAAAAAGRAGKGRWAPLPMFLFALFAFAALRANRNRELFAVAAVPLLVEPLCDLPRRMGRGAIARLRRVLGGRAFALAVMALLAAAGVHGLLRGVRISEGHRRPVGWGAGPGAPAAATDFVRDAGLRGNPFHEMRFGGWMIRALFPEHRVYIDGRQLLYGKELFDEYVRILRAGPDFDRLVVDRGIEWTLLRNPAVLRNAAGDDPYPPLAAALGPRPDWGLVWFDDVAVIHARRDGPNGELLQRMEITAVDPTRPGFLAEGTDPRADRERLLREAAVLDERCPGRFPRIVAASVRGRAGDLDAALAGFDEMLALPRGTAAREQAIWELHELGRDLLQEERAGEAVRALDRARRETPRQVSLLNDLGVAHAALGDLEAARSLWTEALAIDPADADARSNLARLDAAGS